MAHAHSLIIGNETVEIPCWSVSTPVCHPKLVRGPDECFPKDHPFFFNRYRCPGCVLKEISALGRNNPIRFPLFSFTRIE